MFSLWNVEWYKIPPSIDLVTILIQECHAWLQAALEDALVVFEQEHYDAPHDHAKPGEGLEILWHEGKHAFLLQTFSGTFQDTWKQVENYLLVDRVLISPNHIGANDSRYKGENGVMTFEHLLKYALCNFVDKYKWPKVSAVHPSKLACCFQFLKRWDSSLK